MPRYVSGLLDIQLELSSNVMQGRFTRDGIEVLTNARVKEVRKDRVLFSQVEDGKEIIKEVPTGFCLWSTGVGTSRRQTPSRDYFQLTSI